jgi:hypothetical protein
VKFLWSLQSRKYGFLNINPKFFTYLIFWMYESGYIMWSNWNTAIKRRHSTISNAYQKFSYIEAPGIHIHIYWLK